MRNREFNIFTLIAMLSVLTISPSLAAQEKTWEEIQPIAEAQHEIVLLLIEKEQFDQVTEAAKKIFELPFPKEEEHRVVQEAQVLVDALLHHGQSGVAHDILQAAMKCVSTSKSKATLHRERAYVYKHEGDTDAAMAEFERSVALQESEN